MSNHAPPHASLLAPFGDAPTTVDVINELLRTKARAGKADDYLRNLRVHLRKFSQAVDNAPLR